MYTILHEAIKQNISENQELCLKATFFLAKGKQIYRVSCWKKEHLFPIISGFHHFASPILTEINAMANRKDYSNNNYTMHFQS